MKKVLMTLLALVLVFSLAACGSSAEGAAPAGESKPAEEKAPESTAPEATEETGDAAPADGKTLSVLVQPFGNLVDIKTNDYTKWLEEKTGIHLDFTIIESGSTETISMMLNSGEALADVLMVPLTYEQQYLYGQQGILMGLQSLIEENAPNVVKAFKDYPLYAATSTRPDGEIYYISAYEECFHCTGAQKMWINQQWLENLGLQHPTTTEEFKQMLIAFRDQDANGNGDATDEIPMSGFYNSWHTEYYAYLMNAFVSYAGSNDPMKVDNGKVSPSVTADEWREGLRYVADLYKEGLIDENGFVQDGATFKALTTGENVLVGAAPAGHTGMLCDVDNKNIYQFTALAPLKGPNGAQFAGYYPNVAKTGDGMALSSNCSDPKTAMALVDFMFSEEATICSQYGMEGRDWAYNDDASVLGLNDEKALFTTFGKNPVFQATQNTASWVHTGPFLWVDYIFAGQAVLGGESYDLEKVLYDETKDYVQYFPKEFCMSLSFEGDDAEFVAQTKTVLKDYIERAASEFILGVRNIDDDAAWDAYLAELEGLGLTQYVEIMQKGYDAQQAVIASLK